MKLQELEKNETATIKKINTNKSIKRRLLDLGLTQGTKAKPILESVSGGIRAYEIRGSLIAIRKEEATKIDIEKK